jgi:diguanylate cyclase (GGDEF)-like protein
MRGSKPLAVMMMDLDRFKYVNDTLGHPIGDMLLCEVARRLRGTLQRQTDTVARLGGDEFGVLLPTDDLDAARLLATRMLRALEEPITIEGQLVDVGASIGIVTFPENGSDMNVLLRRADIAMYVAKRSNLGFSLYDERHDQNSAERLSLMSELRQAVERDELTLYYQPKVDLATQHVRYVEALVRWDHPTRGFVSPDQFIPFAEQTGYIKTISRWVADRAIAQCAAWRAQGLEIEVSVNVSARELIQSSLPETFQALLDKHGVLPEWIWIEITESAIMDDPNHAIETLDRLHALGIRLSIDDFGTGYSSLSYLKRMPVDEIKIDKSFVMGMTDHKDDETIVRSTIDLGHNMGLKVVAEGVENEEMMLRLKALRCDLAQGFHLSRPLPPARLESWLKVWAGQREEPVVSADAMRDIAVGPLVT